MNYFLNILGKSLANKKFLLLLFLLLVSVFSAFSEEAGKFYLDPRLVPWGIDTDFCFRFGPGLYEGVDTILRFTVGSAINWNGYYRDENDIYTDSRDFDYMYTRLNANWGLGLEQGLLWNDETNKNLLSLFLRYKGMRVWNFDMFDMNSILFDSIRPDKDGVLSNTFIVSLIFDNTFFHQETGLKQGFYTEFSIEKGPKWFFNDTIGIADFTKVFMGVKYFHPVHETKDKEKTIIKAIYFADSAGVDYSFGDNIPLPARQTFGVHRPEDGCGGKVRGFETRRFDSEVKVINNFDIRFIMPKVKTKSGTKVFRPGFLTFFDACYFAKLEGYKDTGEGVLMSAGFSIFSEFLFMGNCVLTVGFPIIGERIDKNPTTISVDYGLRF